MYAKTRSSSLVRSLTVTALLVSWGTLTGCTLEKKDDAGEFRDAVPQSQAIALSGPDASGTVTQTAAEGQSSRTLGTGASTPYAKWYGFTRDMRDGVNAITGAVLGSVWLVVQTTPSAVSADSATWGPWHDELDPATYRVRVTRVAPDEYDYALEGRSKTSTADADFRTVLSGHGYGKPHAKHGQGTFVIDLDVAKVLDPQKHPDDSGTVTVTHDLPHDFSDDLQALPRAITAAVEPAGDAHYTVESKAASDHTGSIHVDAHVDIDDSKDTLLEDVLIDSRWAASGAGRADIDIAGGDLPASIPMVRAVECWGSDFMRSYYMDSQSFAPTEGDAAACVYDEPSMN